MPNFVVHIGPHKTGTTYIQRHLDLNANRLLSHGILVPSDWRDSREKPSHTGLARRLNEASRADLEARFRGWRDAGLKTVVISCEDLADRNTNELSILKDMLGTSPVSIVFYIRRWSELIYSNWHEFTSGGDTAMLVEAVARTLSMPRNMGVVNIATYLTAFESVFGLGTIKIVSYNEVIDAKLDIFEHFVARFLDAGISCKGDAEKYNASFSPAEAELIRLLNYVDIAMGKTGGPTMATHWKRRRQEIDATNLLSYIAGFARTLELRDDAAGVRSVLEENWSHYGRCAIAPFATDRFYRPRVTKLSYFSPDYMLAPQFPEIVRALRGELLK